MARKRKKPTQLSRADKKALSRILKKARAIKAEKAAAAPPATGNAKQDSKDYFASLTSYTAATQNAFRISKLGNFNSPSNQLNWNNANSIAAQALANLQRIATQNPAFASRLASDLQKVALSLR